MSSLSTCHKAQVRTETWKVVSLPCFYKADLVIFHTNKPAFYIRYARLQRVDRQTHATVMLYIQILNLDLRLCSNKDLLYT